MPNREDIAAQQQLLATYRRSLAHHLTQQAALGKAYAPMGVAEGIREARANIKRIKRILQSWGQIVEELPDDEPLDDSPPHSIISPSRPRIFISYKRNAASDEDVALMLFERLRQQYDVFIDQVMPVGTYWAQHLEAEIRRSDFLIVLLSEQSVLSEMVLEEVRTASSLAIMQEGRPAILPVRLNYREPFPSP